MVDRCGTAGAMCSGIQICDFHHSFEFAPLANGPAGLEISVERIDRKLMTFEIDVFWLAIGGRDSVRTLEQFDGRASQVHLKDLLTGTPAIHDPGKVCKESLKEVSEGSIDVASVIAVAKRIGVAQCHVEQDQSPDPLSSIAQSSSNLLRLPATPPS